MSGAWRLFCAAAASALRPLSRLPMAAGHGVLWLADWFEAQAKGPATRPAAGEKREVRS